ncbi:hypothetical protein [Vibrio sp. MEBiC08052]|uniref:hypothetical protein n=1 Tax=Vibrio sp. MEBiC08052 TaxID=1761910 RepID=UPI0007407D64|nr:hypothetical protein [Vibrio sp. MEBiC08052]KUJ00759.1 hypothetical protein VRK_02610 [Vibrio sp. MEBiC08052]
MANHKLAGFMFVFVVLSIAVATAFDYIGTTIEQAIQFVTQIMTFYVVIALFGIWKKVDLFTHKSMKMIALLYPTLVVIRTIYPLFEYAEQTIPRTYIFAQSVEIIISLLIAGIFLAEVKK